MKEAKNNILLNQYLREMRKNGFYCYYELKVAINGRFTFSKIEAHQDEALPALAKEGLVWKWSDEDSRRKPCDGASLPPLPSYLIIRFKDCFCFLNYSVIAKMRAEGIKSITHEEAFALSTKVIRT